MWNSKNMVVMKKTYMRPISYYRVIEKAIMLTTSGETKAGSGTTVLSRERNSVWEDDEDE